MSTAVTCPLTCILTHSIFLEKQGVVLRNIVRRTITRTVHRKRKRGGDLPHINHHTFRHTVASVLLANGTDIVTVSKQLGHANVTTTESFYSHIIEENKAKAAECIADVQLTKKA